jgi:hypothetical protein
MINIIHHTKNRFQIWFGHDFRKGGIKFIRIDGLTQQEGKVMDALVEAWNEYIKLEKQHPSDIDEFKNGIHKCQHALTIRILRRDYPEGYLIK